MCPKTYEPLSHMAGMRLLPAEAAQVVSQPDAAGARDAFLAAYPVFMHPRCMNCHPVGDIPLQGEGSHLHTQGVKRGADGQGLYGMQCGACHQLTNLPGANMPPGVPHWHMPPPDDAHGIRGEVSGRSLPTNARPATEWWQKP